jgi:hypothetical protein
LAGGEETPRVTGELLSRGCERDITSVASEEGDAELVLKLADLPRQRRLGDMQRGRGAPVVKLFGDREEVPKLAEIQVEREGSYRVRVDGWVDAQTVSIEAEEALLAPRRRAQTS